MKYISFILLSLGVIWVIIRIKKTNDVNVLKINETRTIFKEINSNNNILFLSSGGFNDNGYYIWDIPSEQPLTNVINPVLLITGNSEVVLRKYQIENLLEELPYKRNVLICGQSIPLFKEFYKLKYGWDIKIEIIPKFKSMPVYRIAFNDR